MKTILQLFLIGVVILSLTNCSDDDDDFMILKKNLVGTWEHIDNEDYKLTFNTDNTMSGTLEYDIDVYYYGFFSLDSIAFFRDISGSKNEYAFELLDKENTLILKEFRRGGVGTKEEDYIFHRID
jgi:hypothetical protein